MIHNNVEFNTPQSIANEFAVFFNSVYVPCDTSVLCSPLVGASHFGDCLAVSGQEVKTIIMTLPQKPTRSADQIPCNILRNMADIFYPPLTMIINASLSSGVFPSRWKLARICPVFKKDSRNNITNYRPIAILSAFSKVYEILLYRLLYPFLAMQLTSAQYGFVPR